MRQYSVKANDVPAIVAEVDVARLRGQRRLARRVGDRPARRRAERPDHARGRRQDRCGPACRRPGDRRPGHPLAWVALESADEAEVVTRMARRAGLGRGDRPALDVLVRLNPDVAPETIAGLAVGAGASKFGMTETEATGRRRMDHVARDRAPSGRAASTCTSARSCARSTPGGTPSGVASRSSGCCAAGSRTSTRSTSVAGSRSCRSTNPVPAPERFARELPALLDAVPADRRPTRLAIEPGRALVARSGWLVARVLHVRDRGGRQVVIDAGMTELIRPALYGARHPIVALTRRAGRSRPTTTWPSNRPASRGRSANPPMPSASTTSRRSDAATSSRSPTPAPTPPRSSSTYNGRPRAPQVFIETDGTPPTRPAGAIVTGASR